MLQSSSTSMFHRVLPTSFWWSDTAQKMKFSINDFFSKCDQIQSFLITFTEEIFNGSFIFCAVRFFFGGGRVFWDNAFRTWVIIHSFGLSEILSNCIICQLKYPGFRPYNCQNVLMVKQIPFKYAEWVQS